MNCCVASKKVHKKRTGWSYLRTSKFKTSLQSAKQTKSDIQNFILHLKPFSVIEVLFRGRLVLKQPPTFSPTSWTAWK